MKSNKERNFLSFLKPGFIAILIFVLVSAIVFAIFGFNKGFDFTGGTQLVVNIAIQNENEPKGMTPELYKTADEIKTLLNENQIKINSFQVQGEYTDKAFVITFKNVSEQKLRDIRIEINSRYNKATTLNGIDETFDITKNTTQIDGKIAPNTTLITVATLLFALIICMLYSLFRVGVSGALSIVLGGFLSAVLTLCFLVLTRIEINTYLFVALALITASSLFMTVDTMFKLKYKAKDPMFFDKNNHELANIVVKENLTKNIIVSAFMVGASVIIGIVGVLNVLRLGLVCLIGAVVATALNLFIIPAFWAWASKKREIKQVKTQVNTVDKDAKVIEIEE